MTGSPITVAAEVALGSAEPRAVVVEPKGKGGMNEAKAAGGLATGCGTGELVADVGSTRLELESGAAAGVYGVALGDAARGV